MNQKKMLKKARKLFRKVSKKGNFQFFLSNLEPIVDSILSEKFYVSEGSKQFGTITPGTTVKVWSHVERKGSRPSNATNCLATVAYLRRADPPPGWAWVMFQNASGSVELISLDRIELLGQ